MKRLTRTQVPLLASYSSPFVLIIALGLNLFLFRLGVTTGFVRLLILSLSFPSGFFAGRLLYFRRSHVEITYDEKTFQLMTGRKRTTSGTWLDYKLVSIVLDQYGRPDLRLYKSFDGEFVDLPVSRTGASAQEVRKEFQVMLAHARSPPPSPQAVEAV